MATKVKVECSLNTTECILETIASILGEIQEQNEEYNWDPLTFVFTAIIGVIAILFAALTAFQSFLAAGPGRTKSGAYAIGPWSRLNHRKFDLTEMRFRTTASTPILTADSLNFAVLGDEGTLSQDPVRLRKGNNDYFPATWLALLSHLSLDKTGLWDEVKITGADFIPSDLPAVPAYGSITFVITLAMILSRGCGRLTVDRESGLPRVRDRHFNLIFRHHPLLGAIGFFEMYGKIPFTFRRHTGMLKRLLQAHGYFGISELGYSDLVNVFIRNDGELPLNPSEFHDFRHIIEARIQCPHVNQELSACRNALCRNARECAKGLDPGFYINGPLYLSMVPVPSSDLLPFFFPHQKAKLRERLDTLLLQSRFWGMETTAYRDVSLNQLADGAGDCLHLNSTPVSWAKANVNPNIADLAVDTEVYKLCSKYLKQSPTQKKRIQ
ncbi:hypothetical protein NW752_002416 [Fusarium irregulare]|uniref:Uncharacterized protein n=1 Tax=Fusarium irregulare TaxID=2494466 RepID=A0A9W8PHU1_9HYPO|nr:hypothetical protein NW766_011133 [Fusarium irregulare]KAJ4024962.1 hypothetical protein NW752_002416 [Fusarium irregulare]